MHVPGIVTVGGLGRGELRERLARAGVRLNAYAERLFSDERFRTARRAARVCGSGCSGNTGSPS